MRLIKYSFILGVVLIITSCEENERMLYDTEYNALNFIMPGFEHVKPDSLYVNFMFYPQEKSTDTLKIEVRLLGMPSSHNRHYKVKEVTSRTTAEKGIHFDYKDEYVFPADTTRAKFELYLKRDESLKDSTYRIEIQFEETDEFKTGLSEYHSFILNVTDNLDTPPPFWEMNYLHYYAGEYHPSKCQRFILIAGVDSPDWVPEIYAAVDEYIKLTKKWFEENPTYDEDGNRLYFEFR